MQMESLHQTHLFYLSIVHNVQSVSNSFFNFGGLNWGTTESQETNHAGNLTYIAESVVVDILQHLFSL